MADNDTDQQDRQHTPTTRQRQRYVDEGKFPHSKELSSAVILTVGSFVLVSGGQHTALMLMNFCQQTFQLLSSRGQVHTVIWKAFGSVYVEAILIIFAASMATGVAIGLLQNRTIAFTLPKFDLERLNPIPRLQGLFFSQQALVTIGYSFGKFAILLWIFGGVLMQQVPRLLQQPASNLRASLKMSGQVLRIIAIRGVFIILLLGVIDYLWSWYQIEKSMRMSTQEVRDEAKSESGDGRTRSRLRKKQVEFTKQRSLREVPTADVVLVNPTHYAVALVYQAKSMQAPRLVAKGADAYAARIRSIARQHGIPVITQPALTRLLYNRVPIGKYIPEDLYQAVAVILAHVFRVRGRPA